VGFVELFRKILRAREDALEVRFASLDREER